MDEAHPALERLRDLIKGPKHANDAASQQFLHEAEALNDPRRDAPGERRRE